MFKENKVCQLFDIQYPIVQGGMVWCSGWRLVAAVSNAGGLGLLGAGSMTPDLLRDQIIKTKKATNKPFGVNIPLLYAHVQDHINVILEEGVKIVFTSAGNPKSFTSLFKEHGITVVHVVSSVKFALKAQEAGVDAIVAEGFEAGGHNGREETTTLCLIPEVAKAIKIPLIAAGGVSSGKTFLASLVLGADGVQIGSRFAVCEQSSAHLNFKNLVFEATEGATRLSLKKLAPVRLLKNQFHDEVLNAELNGASAEELKELLSKGRAKKGMLEGDLIEGELEIGQASASISKMETVDEIFFDLISGFENELDRLKKL